MIHNKMKAYICNLIAGITMCIIQKRGCITVKRILILGAGGMTGTGVLKELAKTDMRVTAFAHNEQRRDALMQLGADEVIIGDMECFEDLSNAMKNQDVVYHITSAFNPMEYEIGKLSINAAKANGISHFVYQSVLHSNMTQLVHHWKKNQVEEYLVESGLPFTIVQPTVFMQNILRSWPEIQKTGVFRQKFYTEKDSAIAMIDLDDFAEAVSIIIRNPEKHLGATYELSGPEMLNAAKVKTAMEYVLGRKITFSYISDEDFVSDLKKMHASDYRIQGMTKMYQHYNDYDFPGSPFVLEAILGRKPNTIAQCLSRQR